MTRASDAEREATVQRLRAAAEEGRLDVEELTGRLDGAYAARTRAELDALTEDLPAAGAPVPVGGGSTSFILGLFGGGDRKGRWRVAERVTVVNGIGGADLDLREAVLAAPEVEITIFTLVGGSDILVPEGVHVDVGGFALIGGNDTELEGPAPPPGAPVVRIRAYTLVGGTDVRSSPRRRGLRPPRLR
jgi:Domain of unknown function (DUF1707)/Cell wall-active antibiotics response 4TMS YvqF